MKDISISPKLNKLIENYTKHCQRIAMATTIDLNESTALKIKRRTRLERNYVDWVEYYFPNYAKVKCAPFHTRMANLILKNQDLRFLAEMYRSAGKSVHIDLFIPLYLYLVKKELNFMMLIGETERKAKKLLSDISAQISFNNRLINDYGARAGTGSWADGDFCTSDGVRFISLGFGQDPRGSREGAERPDYIVCDDCDSKKHVNNDRLMRESVDFILEDVWGCFDTAEGCRQRFIFANNNFHKNSITNRLKGYFKEIEKTGDTEGSIYKVLTVKAVNNIKDFTPTWLAKTSAEYWKDKFKKLPYRSFMREYMHTHIEDGAIFKHEDLKYTEPLPLKQYDALCFYGDLSYKENADYKAMILLGKKGTEYHVIFSYLQQKSRAHCARWLYDMYDRHKLHRFNIRYMIEGLFAQDMFVNDFDTEADNRGVPRIPVVADKRPKADKYDRVESLTGYWERGWWFFCTGDTTDQQVLIDQFMAFEKGSKAHDDGPDACHGGIAYLNKRTRNSAAKYSYGSRRSDKW